MNKVVFVPGSKSAELLVPRPKPSKNYLADWFKDMPPMLDNFQSTAKKCLPFTDSLTHGYIQELWCDVRIIKRDKGVQYLWTGKEQPMSTRGETEGSPNLFPPFDGYYDAEFHWITKYEPRTPKGYSTLYSHPSSRFDLPFVTLSGIIDTDTYHGTGPLPFIIKKDFEGIIPAGTPLYQMTFIKRDNWDSDVEPFNEEKSIKQEYSVRKYFYDGYRKLYWSKKSFN